MGLNDGSIHVFQVNQSLSTLDLLTVANFAFTECWTHQISFPIMGMKYGKVVPESEEEFLCVYTTKTIHLFHHFY